MEVGKFPDAEFLDRVFVAGIEIGVEKAHGEGFDPMRVDEALDGGSGVVDVERCLDVSFVADALGYFGAHVSRDHRGRVLEAQIEHVVAQLEPHVGNIHEAFGRQHAGRGTAALDHGVGHEGRAVDHGVDIRHGDAMVPEQGGNALEHGGRGIGRRRQPLVDGHGALRLVEQREVGERAADVDSDTIGHVRSLLVSDPGSDPGSDTNLACRKAMNQPWRVHPPSDGGSADPGFEPFVPERRSGSGCRIPGYSSVNEWKRQAGIPYNGDRVRT